MTVKMISSYEIRMNEEYRPIVEAIDEGY